MAERDTGGGSRGHRQRHPHDYALRPKVSYNFTDHWKGTVGADLFRGPEETFYGRLRDISTEFVELRYSF